MENKVKVYIAEDDEDNILLLTQAIEESRLSYGFVFFSDGKALLRSLLNEPLPDLILSDLKMSGEDGFDILTFIKSHEMMSTIPVVILSSSKAPGDISKAYSLGASDYFVKPSSFEELVAIVCAINDGFLR